MLKEQPHTTFAPRAGPLVFASPSFTEFGTPSLDSHILKS